MSTSAHTSPPTRAELRSDSSRITTKATVTERSALVRHDNTLAPDHATKSPPPSKLPWPIRLGEEHFTWRAIFGGLLVGSVLACINTVFGLQSGWITMGSMQASLLGFGLFRGLQKLDAERFGSFTAIENVLLQSTAVAAATGPLAYGFVAVIPALTMLKPALGGPVLMSFGQLLLWSIALAFFGAFFAIPLRRHTIINEKLPFPSGTATASLIAVLHDLPPCAIYNDDEDYHHSDDSDDEISAEHESHPYKRMGRSAESDTTSVSEAVHHSPLSIDIDSPILIGDDGFSSSMAVDFERKWRVLLYTFAVSGTLNAFVYFFPVLSDIPIMNWFGAQGVTQWQWKLKLSLAYVGQGMIMGFKTGISMLSGAILAWGILAPIALSRGWVTDPTSWSSNGGLGWILWVSLAMLFAESLTSISLLSYSYMRDMWIKYRRNSHEHSGEDVDADFPPARHEPRDPAPEEEQVQRWVWMSGLALSSLVCVVIFSTVFSIPVYEPIVALIVALLVSVISVRSLGQTDFNPVSGVGKLSQLVFAVVAPGNVVSSLLSGAVAESGAQMAGDMMQDLKTGHLLRASPKSQFYAQLIGSCFSIIFSVAAYLLITSSYAVPSSTFPVPTAHLWLEFAQLINDGDFPTTVEWFAAASGVFGVVVTLLVHQYAIEWLPNPTAIAIGMYLTPDWTIPRVIGSVTHKIWQHYWPDTHSDYMIVVASGFVLGEGVVSIITAFLHMMGVPTIG
jgi:OPT family oligopeptide transporter